MHQMFPYHSQQFFACIFTLYDIGYLLCVPAQIEKDILSCHRNIYALLYLNVLILYPLLFVQFYRKKSYDSHGKALYNC